MANIAVPPTPQNVMTGPVEYKVYVYDNRPLLRIPPGHRFLTGIVRQRTILTSGLTDTEYDTPDVYLEVQHPCWSCNSNSSSANASAGVR